MGGKSGVWHGGWSLSVLCINISPDVDYCKGELGIIASQREYARQIIDVQERQAMWVRAVAVAAAVACCAVSAQAAQYAEVWNPPEARHAPKQVKVHVPADKKVAVRGAAGGKSKRQKVEPKKASVHAGHQVKPHSRLAAKSAPRKAVKTARAKGATSKAVTTARLKDSKGTPSKVVNTAHSGAAHVQTAVHSKSQKVAAKPAATQAAVAMTNPTARAVPTQPAATMATNTAANPSANSAAGSRDLPPILH
jgi:hypothetical protein